MLQITDKKVLMNKYILYFGRFDLPDNNALAHRVKANAIALNSLGYSPFLFGYSKDMNPSRDRLLETDGLPYLSFRYPDTPVEWLRDFKSYKVIERFIKEKGADNIAAIIFTDVGAGNTFGLLKISRKYSIPLVSDVVDWFSYDKGLSLRTLVKRIESSVMKRLTRKVENYICISTYLQSHYQALNKNTIVIPSLTFEKDSRFIVQEEYHAEDVVRICYAGSPGIRGSKDRIDWVVRAFSDVDSNKAKLLIYGIGKEEFCTQFPEYSDLTANESICFYGRRSNKECIHAIATSDFFTFARISNQMTSAGFPTKYSESAALSTPVVTTPTSDLKHYITNSVNGFLSSECTFESYRDVLAEAVATSKEKRQQMHSKRSPLDEKLWEERIGMYLVQIINH